MATTSTQYIMKAQALPDHKYNCHRESGGGGGGGAM